MSDKNETLCPWEPSISPRAKIIGLLLLLLLVLALAIPVKRIVAFVTGGFVRGVVVLKGQPQEGLEIHFRMVELAMKESPPGRRRDQPFDPAQITHEYSATTDSNGAFWVRGLKPGTYTIFVLDPRKKPPGRFLPPWPSEVEVKGGFQKVDVFVTEK